MTSSGSSGPGTRAVASPASRFSDCDGPLWVGGSGKHPGDSAFPGVNSPTSNTRRPSVARASFSWSLLPSSDWLEKRKRKRRKKQAAGLPSTTHATDEAPRQCKRSRSVRLSSKGDGDDHTVTGSIYSLHTMEQVPFIKRPSIALRSSTSDIEKIGLYRRSKQFIRELRWSSSSKVERDPSDSDSEKSKTRDLLEKTSSLLQVFALRDRDSDNPSSAPLTPSPSGDSGSSRRLQHLLRRNGTVMSKSSSILDMLMGKPPASTPTAEALYAGTDRDDYFKVEISDPDGPTFLPSEARRIGTPPLPSDRPRQGNMRGFFFDYASPGGMPYTSSESDLHERHHSSRRTDTMESEERLPFRFDPDAQEPRFELNVPEHLPGSPLCPRSPLHPSGGKGICVYHGRTRTMPLET